MAVGSSDGFGEAELNEAVSEGSLDFEAWTSLISHVEQFYHDDFDKICLVYDSFLSEFPLCYGYWKKYSEHKARLCGIEDVGQIFERAVELAPYSVDLWLDYCNFGVSSFVDPLDVSRLFDRGLSFVGKDYLCYKIWDKFIEYEFSQQRWSSLANIYIHALKFPTKKLHQYYESFKKLVGIWEEEMQCQGISHTKVQSEYEIVGDIKASEDAEISHVISDLLDPSTRSKALLKYISIGEKFYKKACDLDGKVKKFEQNIRRPYFHVKPLDDSQLQNWHQYLDLVEMEGDFDWAVKLYERCLISCANYSEFWMRYVDYVESMGGREIAKDALERATLMFVKNSPQIHLFNAWFKEEAGDVDGVRAAFEQCDQDFVSHIIDIVGRKANMERRLGNYVAASNIYKEALDMAAERRPEALPMLYLHFAHLQFMITKNVEATREVLLNGLECVPHSELLLKELLLFAFTHEGAIQMDIVDSVMAKALSPGANVSGGLSAKEREDMSRLYLEFVDFCGSIRDIRRAWNRHLKLFPHSVRVQSSLRKPSKAGTFWKMITDERPGRFNSSPQNSAGNHSENHLIQLHLPKEKHLEEDHIVQSEVANDGSAQVEHDNVSSNDLEMVPSEVPRTLTKDASRENGSSDRAVNKNTADRSPLKVESDDLLHEQEQKIQQNPSSSDVPSLNHQDDESRNRTTSPSPEFEPPPERCLSDRNTHRDGHDIGEVPKISGPANPGDANAAERYNESPSPSVPSHKNRLVQESNRHSEREKNWRRLNLSGKGRSDVGSSGNSYDRRERSLSPRRRSSHWYSDDRRHRERSLSPRSPRRHNSRQLSEERWHQERRQRRSYRYNDNSRGRRDGRMQNENQVVVVGNTVPMPNVQHQTSGFASQTQINGQPISYSQGQINQCLIPSNEQYGNTQNNQLYNQMWQYYYYNQQQQLPYQQQPLQQMQPLQQLPQQMQNPSQQQLMQASQQPQQLHAQQQQILNLQYQQQMLSQQPQFQQQHQQQPSNEQPQSQEQQLQLQQLIQSTQQQLYQQLQQQQQQQVQIQQQQPQVRQQEEVDSQKQEQQAYQCQQLQQQQPQVQQHEEVDLQKQQQQQQEAYQQQYLLYLKQLQQYHYSQQQPGLVKDQQSLPQQQQLPTKEEGLEKSQELQHTDERSQSELQQDDGTVLVHSRSSSHCQQGPEIEDSHASASSRVASLSQSQDQLPEIEGTDI